MSCEKNGLPIGFSARTAAPGRRSILGARLAQGHFGAPDGRSSLYWLRAQWMNSTVQGRPADRFVSRSRPRRGSRAVDAGHCMKRSDLRGRVHCLPGLRIEPPNPRTSSSPCDHGQARVLLEWNTTKAAQTGGLWSFCAEGAVCWMQCLSRRLRARQFQPAWQGRWSPGLPGLRRASRRGRAHRRAWLRGRS